MQNKKIIFLASDCESSRWVFNALKEKFVFEMAIIEAPLSKKKLFLNRLKKNKFFAVAGQAVFSLLMVPWLKRKAKKRKDALINQYNLNNNDFDLSKTIKIPSVNDESCKKLLQQINPTIVLVNGTRIISKKILQSTNAVFINMHMGITPLYRGSHGGYWALHNNDAANFGTTIHLIDAGVDTGEVLKQVFITPDKADNFTTYPVLQAAIGIAALKEVLPVILSGNYSSTPNTIKGKMYYQPTLFKYLISPVA